MAADKAFFALFFNSVEFFKQDSEIFATVVAMVVNRRSLFKSRLSEKRELQTTRFQQAMGLIDIGGTNRNFRCISCLK